MTRPWQILAVAFFLITTCTVGLADNGGDPFAVPEGGPDKQAAFLQQLFQQRPHDAETAAKMQAAAVKAADKILAGKPSAQQFEMAVEVEAEFANDADALTSLESKLHKQGRAKQARLIHGRLLMVQLEKESGDPAGFRKQLETLKAYLSKGPLSPTDAKLAQSAARIAQQLGDDALVCETYESLSKLLAADPQTAAAAKQMQGVARRMKLVGNSMQLQGMRLDGSQLDWSKYRGKVVLVDFWATWCGPCMAEMPNIKSNYEKYHGKGFDVVGISLDRMDRQQLAAFVEKEGVAWAICRDSDASSPMADYYGVEGIPTLILVGRDGKVISLNARGEVLGPLVEKALAAPGGPVADDTTAEDAPAKGKAGAAATTAKNDKAKAREAAIEAAKERREEAAKARAAAVAKARQWTDTTGGFHVSATFRGMANQVVKLQLEDGSMINVPLEKLSDDDQDYIHHRSR